MHTTPFKHVQYHMDGRHIFTVNVGEETKRFVTTEDIPVEKALLNALSWRDSVTGVPLANPDKPKIDWFVRSLEEPDVTRSINVTPAKPAPREMIIPDSVRSRLEGHTTLPPKPTVTRTLPLKAMVEGRNRKYPSLPSAVNPNITQYRNGNSPSYAFVVNYRLNGKAATKTFYMGTRETLTLSKYRVIRHVAISFRKEYLHALAESREMDLDAFVSYYDKLRAGTFRWPFKGTVPPRLSTKHGVNGRAIHAFQTARMEGQNSRYPSLPSGVAMTRQCKEGKTDQILFRVSYADMKGNTKIKTFYAGIVGNLKLTRYRMARHVAMAFRKEYLESRITRRPMRLELFEDWKEKLVAGTFFVPFKFSVSEVKYDRPVASSATEATLLNSRAGVVAQNVVETLRAVPELTAALSEMSDERLAQIALMIRNPVNEALYSYQKK